MFAPVHLVATPLYVDDLPRNFREIRPFAVVVAAKYDPFVNAKEVNLVLIVCFVAIV